MAISSLVQHLRMAAAFDHFRTALSMGLRARFRHGEDLRARYNAPGFQGRFRFGRAMP